MVGLLDTDDDCRAEFFAGLPALTVQDVLLQQAEEGLHRSVVGAGTDAAHVPPQLRVAERTNVGAGAELLPLSEWTIVSTAPRSDRALRSALTASSEVIRLSIEYPTMRLEQASLIAQR